MERAFPSAPCVLKNYSMLCRITRTNAYIYKHTCTHIYTHTTYIQATRSAPATSTRRTVMKDAAREPRATTTEGAADWEVVSAIRAGRGCTATSRRTKVTICICIYI